MPQPNPAGMMCPVCSTGLTMSERQGVEIDYCPTCRGVWLDRGELDKIIERSAADLMPVSQPAPQRSQPSSWGQERRAHGHHDNHYGHRKRRKSFLEELFD